MQYDIRNELQDHVKPQEAFQQKNLNNNMYIYIKKLTEFNVTKICMYKYIIFKEIAILNSSA